MLSIDFKNFNKKGLKKVVDAFEKQALPVAEVAATNRPKRESGFQTKAATLHFESGQKLLLKAKSNGSIFQVKLNNKAIPIKHVDDLNKAVKEVISFVKKNEPKFLKAKKKREERAKGHIPKPPKPATTSAKKQLDQVSQTLGAIKDEISGIEKEVETSAGNVQAKTANLETLRLRLEEENQESETLQAELDALKEAA